MTNSTELIDLPDQPDGIEDDSRDLPDPLRAARRVGEYIAANGDGMYDRIGNVPLYARDLEALRRATESAEQVQAERDQARIQVECLTADTDDRDSEISSLRQDLDFQTKAAFDNQAEVNRLRAELNRRQAVVDAATAWHDAIQDDPRQWADQTDFGLIAAVRILRGEERIADVGKCPACGKQSRSYARGCSNCGHGGPADKPVEFGQTSGGVEVISVPGVTR